MKRLYFFLLFVGLNNFAQNFNFQRSWGTYFGDDRFMLQDSKVDKNGDLYIVGVINSQTLPTPIFSTPNPFSPNYNGGGGDGFIAKFNNTGQLVWATYFGGSEKDSINGIDIDANNNIYVVGLTESTSNISTINSFQPNYAGDQDFFISSFSQNGSLLWSSYYGGISEESSYPGNEGNVNNKRLQICHDKSNNFYISGYSFSTDLGTIGTFQSNAQQSQFIIAKFSNSGIRLWCTYYGINANFITALSANSINLYVRGTTAECFPPLNISNSYYGTIGSFQPNPNFCFSTFLSKFNIDGDRDWSTYYPSSRAFTNTVKVSNNKIYIAGFSSNSTLVTTSGSNQETTSTNISTGHLVQFNENGTRNWGTYVGFNSSNPLSAFGSFNSNVSLDEQNNPYLSGTTGLDLNIATSGAYQLTNSGIDGYVTKFNDQGEKVWGTYYGGNKQEIDMICIPYSDNFYLIGNTQSTTGMTTPNSYQSTLQNTDPLNNTDPINIFIAHFEPNPLSNKIFEEDIISVTPNPANDFFVVQNSSNIQNTFSFEIIDLTGRIIKRANLYYNQKINIEELILGNYILKIETNDGRKITKKLIKK